MDFVSVISKTVDRIGYDVAAEELHVVFLDGRRHYVYSGVSEQVHQDFLSAVSKGRFVHVILRGNKYPCREIR